MVKLGKSQTVCRQENIISKVSLGVQFLTKAELINDKKEASFLY
jgi:hypothetical protein